MEENIRARCEFLKIKLQGFKTVLQIRRDHYWLETDGNAIF